MPIVGSSSSVNFMITRMSIDRQMGSLDEQLRNAQNATQQKVVEAIQNVALEIKQSAVTQRQNRIGSMVDTFA